MERSSRRCKPETQGRPLITHVTPTSLSLFTTRIPERLLQLPLSQCHTYSASVCLSSLRPHIHSELDYIQSSSNSNFFSKASFRSVHCGGMHKTNKATLIAFDKSSAYSAPCWRSSLYCTHNLYIAFILLLFHLFLCNLIKSKY